MSENRKFQLNLKFGAGFEAPLLNIEGDTQEEFQKNVEFVLNSVDPIVEAAIVFQQAYQLKQPKDESQPAQTNNWSNRGSQNSTQPAASQPSGPAPSCRLGEMKDVRAGFSKRTNKPYNAFWSCTGPRNDQCDTQPAS